MAVDPVHLPPRLHRLAFKVVLGLLAFQLVCMAALLLALLLRLPFKLVPTLLFTLPPLGPLQVPEPSPALLLQYTYIFASGEYLDQQGEI